LRGRTGTSANPARSSRSLAFEKPPDFTFKPFGFLLYRSVTIMLAATASMTAVAIHPITFCGSGKRTEPVTFSLVVISIITIMIGTAATPLITALQKSALIGLTPIKFNATPSSVAPAKIP
jgi:hypothetical protein